MKVARAARPRRRYRRSLDHDRVVTKPVELAYESRVTVRAQTSAVFASILLAAAIAATAEPTFARPLALAVPLHARTALIHHRCPTGFLWVPDGTISGSTAGYPYYGWFGYPYVPFQCVRLHHRRYGLYRRL